MCRIFGFFGGHVDREQLRQAGLVQLSGGPNENKILVGRGFALGANRLIIQGSECGSQPYIDKTPVFAVFNGEIYNHWDLRKALWMDFGITVAGDCDGSVIIPLYLKYGNSFFSMIEGMFAIVILDCRKNTPEMIMASDTQGIRSIYYSVTTSNNLVFSSDIKGLFPLLQEHPSMDVLAIDQYFKYQCVTDGRTMYKGIFKLRPGEIIHKSGNNVVSKTEFSPPKLEKSEKMNNDLALAGTSLRSVIERQVELMSNFAGSGAIQLSGGLDSSLLASMFARRRKDIVGFHVHYDCQWKEDETVYAQAAAEYADIDIVLVRAEADQVPTLLPEMVRSLTLPNAAPHCLSAFIMLKEIAAQNFRVSISGEGADEQFCGYRRYTRSFDDENPSWPQNYLKRLSVFPESIEKYFHKDYYRDYLSRVDTAADQDVVRLLSPQDRRHALRSYDMKYKLPYFNLARLDDLSMAHGIECRVPFCQPNISSFAASLDPNFLLCGEDNKRVLYTAARGLVPDNVLSRQKQPFTFPVVQMIASSSSLLDYFDAAISSLSLSDLGIINVSEVRPGFHQALRAEDSEILKSIWAFVVLDIWLQQSAVDWGQKIAYYSKNYSPIIEEICLQ